LEGLNPLPRSKKDDQIRGRKGKGLPGHQMGKSPLFTIVETKDPKGVVGGKKGEGIESLRILLVRDRRVLP